MQVRIPRAFSLITYSLLPNKARSHLFALICALLLSSCNSKPSELHYEFVFVTMRKFAIEPAIIRAKQGEHLELQVSTKDVQHGFQVEQLGINESIQPGTTVKIPIDTSKKGEFRVNCSIICGPGHDDMQAKIVIE